MACHRAPPTQTTERITTAFGSNVNNMKVMQAPTKPLFSDRTLRLLILPLAIEQGLAVAVGMADTMMVSSVGEAAVSGVSLVDLITVFIINVFAALATGGAVVISQYLGAKDAQKSRDSASQLVLLSALLGSMVGLIAFAFAPVIMGNLFGALDAEVYQAGLLYLRVSAFSFPFLAMYNAGAAIFRSSGNAKISMRVSVVMNVINVTGNAICIFGLQMGVLGVAVPSVISRFVAAVMILRLASRHTSPVYITMPRHIDTPLAKRILTIGIPSAFENGLFQAGRIMVVCMIATFGTVQIAANAVACNMTALACIPGNAFSLAMITVVGRCIGANDQDQAIYYTKKMMAWAMLVCGGWNLIILFAAPLLLNVYALSAATVTLAYVLVRIHIIPGLIAWPISFVLPNALRAANDIRFTMTTSIISMWLFRICIGYYLGILLGYGAAGIWVGMVCDWVFRAVVFTIRCLSGKWKTKYIADPTLKGATK